MNGVTLNLIPNGQAVVSTPLVTLIKRQNAFQMLIYCKNGSVVEHEPFPLTLEGMVAAISLSAEICAGKFYLNRIVKDNSLSNANLIEE